MMIEGSGLCSLGVAMEGSELKVVSSDGQTGENHSHSPRAAISFGEDGSLHGICEEDEAGARGAGQRGLALRNLEIGRAHV